MIVVPLKEGENIEKALKKFKRKFEKTGVVKRIEKSSGFRKTLCSKEKTNYACCLRSAITAGRRIKYKIYLPGLFYWILILIFVA